MKGQWLRGIFLTIFVGCILVGAGMLGVLFLRGKQEQQEFADLRALIGTMPVKTAEEELYEAGTMETISIAQQVYESPYLPLKEKNSDFFGWVCIPDTIVDYPVMHTPENETYYLYRSFDKATSHSGVPFLSKDSYIGSGNYLIFGHNIKDGSMFHMITDYADVEFWREHPVIRFDTMEEAGEYEILGAFYSKDYTPEETGFRYYQYGDLSDPELFTSYVSEVKRASVYDTGITAEYGDQLLTLSTCSYHVDNGRFVVVGRKIE